MSFSLLHIQHMELSSKLNLWLYYFLTIVSHLWSCIRFFIQCFGQINIIDLLWMVQRMV